MFTCVGVLLLTYSASDLGLPGWVDLVLGLVVLRMIFSGCVILIIHFLVAKTNSRGMFS